MSAVRVEVQRALDACAASSDRFRARLDAWVTAAQAAMKRILVVDDDPLGVTLLKDGLADLGEIAIAKAAAEALEHARAVPFDLVVADVLMPDAPGVELVQRIRARSQRPLVPVVLVSGLDERELDRLARKCGANAYFQKPVDLKALRTVATKLLDD